MRQFVNAAAAVLLLAGSLVAQEANSSNPWFALDTRVSDLEAKVAQQGDDLASLNKMVGEVATLLYELDVKVDKLGSEPTKGTPTGKLASTPTLDVEGAEVCIDADGDGVCDDLQAATSAAPVQQYKTVRVREAVRVPCATCPSGYAIQYRYVTKQVPVDSTADAACECGCGGDCGGTCGCADCSCYSATSDGMTTTTSSAGVFNRSERFMQRGPVRRIISRMPIIRRLFR